MVSEIPRVIKMTVSKKQPVQSAFLDMCVAINDNSSDKLRYDSVAAAKEVVSMGIGAAPAHIFNVGTSRQTASVANSTEAE